MASDTPNTGAPARASTNAVLSVDVLNALEEASLHFQNFGAVLRAGREAIGPEGRLEAHRLIAAAEYLHEVIGDKLTAAVEKGYVELRAWRKACGSPNEGSPS